MSTAGSRFRRLSGTCSPLQIRPIDVFSAILRVQASALVLNLKSWALKVLSPTQFASSGGTWKACAQIAWKTEKAWFGIEHAAGLTVDFEKMFNSLSPHVAAVAAGFMGLHASNVHDLLCPLALSTAVWRLPHNAVPTPFKHERGLPQGMASSVLMAELAIAPLLWKLFWRFGDSLLSVAYVDDLNFICSRAPLVSLVSDVLREYANDFFLSLSVMKSKVWSSREGQIPKLKRDTGLDATKVIEALGAQWIVCRGGKPDYAKELARYKDCESRLSRLQHLPLNPADLSVVISTGCLSKLDYINLPSHRPYQQLRTLAKSVLGLTTGAPEIVLGVLQAGTIDPILRWLIAGFKLWYEVMLLKPSDEDVDVIAASSKGRLGRFASLGREYKVSVSSRGFYLDEVFLSATNLWSVCRKTLVRFLKKQQAASLAVRRPGLYAGITEYNEKQHSRLLRSLSNFDASCLLRVWAGSVMCGHKRAQMYGGSAQCECGDENQTWEHLVWHCPCVPPPPPRISHLARLPASVSVSHILPKGASPDEVGVWRESCLSLP